MVGAPMLDKSTPFIIIIIEIPHVQRQRIFTQVHFSPHIQECVCGCVSLCINFEVVQTNVNGKGPLAETNIIYPGRLQLARHIKTKTINRAKKSQSFHTAD